jgi:hypothetical protein
VRQVQSLEYPLTISPSSPITNFSKELTVNIGPGNGIEIISYTISCNDENANQLWMAITGPSQKILFPPERERQGSSKQYFPFGPHQCCFGDSGDDFEGELKDHEFEFYFNNQYTKDIEIQLLLKVRFLLSTL